MTRRGIVLLTLAVAVAAFTGGAVFHDRRQVQRQVEAAAAVSNELIRPHSPIMGPVSAPVTIVEFFDPSCESCRAFNPIVKQIMGIYPEDVRLVLRYAPLHKGSDEAVRILEVARLQDRFEPVLEALLATQPVWASHGAPDLSKAWEAAERAGLDVARGRLDMTKPAIDAVLYQDVADLKAVGIKGTPTFFVNGKSLPSFGPKQLLELVQAEVAATKLID